MEGWKNGIMDKKEKILLKNHYSIIPLFHHSFKFEQRIWIKK